MIKKILVLTGVFMFSLSFSQISYRDSTKPRPKCNGILNDMVLVRVKSAYGYRINKPTGPKLSFGCGTAAMEYAEEISCMNAQLILKKYPFIIEEIKNTEKNESILSDLNILWVQNDNDNQPKDHIEIRRNELKYKNWESKKQNSPLMISITAHQKDLQTENVLIKFSWPKTKKEIVKEYKVFKNPEWSFTKL